MTREACIENPVRASNRSQPEQENEQGRERETSPDRITEEQGPEGDRRTRRLSIRSRSRRDSYSPPHVRRRYRLSPPPWRLPFVSSHHELFASEDSQSESQFQQDRCVYLGPYDREAYITTHPATHYDFTQWLPLLALGAQETWYKSSTAKDKIVYTNQSLPLLAAPNPNLVPLSDPRPVGLRLARIAATAALRPSSSPPVPVKYEDGSKPVPPNLVYLSIQASITGNTNRRLNDRWDHPDRDVPDRNLPDLADNSLAGQNIYRVIRCGSREEAAAQAFYYAGGNRWSTVFTCAVVAGARSLSGRVMVYSAEAYERVSSVEELIEDGVEMKGEKIKVFY